jgi:PIN domain nuclease of toxin-antitoxin system
MKIAVIDTHVLIWHLSQPTKLAPAAKRFLRAVDQGNAHILIPAIVLIELTLLREAGRRVVGPAEIEALVTSHDGFTVLPMDLPQAQIFVGLGGLRDPFDRMIVAAARTGPYPMLSADNLIAASKLVDVVWD